jgi:hypothetical protein
MDARHLENAERAIVPSRKASACGSHAWYGGRAIPRGMMERNLDPDRDGREQLEAPTT